MFLKLDATLSARTISPSWKRSSICPLEVSRHSAPEVWFVNKQFNLDVKWGTPSPIQIQDPVFGVFVPVRSYGIFGIQIDDAKRFLVKLVGTLSSFTKNDIMRYFRGVYVARVKDAISTYIIERKIGILEINRYLDELSDYLQERIEPVMAEYGISLTNFFVNDISVPEDDPAVVTLKQALAKRAEMELLGYTYVQERSFDTLEGAATNPGSTASDLMGAGLGLGMGIGMGGGGRRRFRRCCPQFECLWFFADVPLVRKCGSLWAEVLRKLWLGYGEARSGGCRRRRRLLHGMRRASCSINEVLRTVRNLCRASRWRVGKCFG